MPRVLILYYSSYGHIERMAKEAVKGAREAGAEVELKRVAEIVPEKVAQKSGYKLDQTAPIAEPLELAEYDAVIFGVPTRYGNMPAQMKNFIDQTGALWMEGKLVGKVGSVFTSTASQHGGQETTLISFHIVLMHLGFVVVGLPYAFQGQLSMDAITGGTPYGASTVAGGDGSRWPSDNELEGVRFQARHVATIAAKLAGDGERREERRQTREYERA